MPSSLLACDRCQGSSRHSHHLNKSGTPFGVEGATVKQNPRLNALQSCVSLARGLVKANCQQNWTILVLGPILGSDVP